VQLVSILEYNNFVLEYARYANFTVKNMLLELGFVEQTFSLFLFLSKGNRESEVEIRCDYRRLYQ